MRITTIKLHTGGEATCESDGSICLVSKDCEIIYINYTDLLLVLQTTETLMNERNL